MFILVKLLSGQEFDMNSYFPSQVQNESWKFKVDMFASEESNSNTFTNRFLKDVNGSKYLSTDLINQQVEKLDGRVLSGTIRSIGGDLTINTDKLSYYVGFEHQYILDTYLDDDFIKLLLKGNKPYAGETLQFPGSEYYSIYFNQFRGGISKTFQQGKKRHILTGTIGLALGQNYNYVKVENSSLYTHPDGNYLDVDVKAETQLSDTVWAEVYEVNGMGASFGVRYNFYKEKEFYFGIEAKNLGFVRWNQNTFVASMDTNFVFEGMNNDTVTGTGDNLPDDYSYKSLRRLVFKDFDSSPFSTGLPVILNLTAGKYFSDAKFYTGVNAFVYPTLKANYKVELFGTWNIKHVFQITPIVAYSSYAKVNAGVGFGIKMGNNFYLRAGSSYLNTLFNSSGTAGAGGYIHLTLVI